MLYSEQGTSASQMAATKFLDAIAHMPDCDGEDADAIGAYKQVRLADAARLFGMGTLPETWISLPTDRWPKDGSWDHITDPVCPLLFKKYLGIPLQVLYGKEDVKKNCLQKDLR